MKQFHDLWNIRLVYIVTVLDAIYLFSYFYKSTTRLSRNAADTVDQFLLTFEIMFIKSLTRF
jgi:hypothetical protein